MNENINLCEILKGYEGEAFYSPVYGYVILKEITNDYLRIKSVGKVIKLYKDGKYDIHGECMLFPYKDQRDWNKWVEEQKRKVPKTWDEFCKQTTCDTVLSATLSYDCMDCSFTESNTVIEKSALALLKIHQLIELGYGGNVTNEEWDSSNPKWIIAEYSKEEFVTVCVRNQQHKSHIAFHTKEQAEEFLTYTENVQLLKDYFMI